MRLKLKEIREKAGLTQEKIAKLIPIARTTYTNIELGEKNPSLRVAIKIKQILDYQDDDIFLIYNVPKSDIEHDKQVG